MAYCDLHTHSHFSDGTRSPRQLLDMAQVLGLSAIALCDHNTVKGLPEFLAAAADRKVEAVPGCEFSTEYDHIELHILGLFLPESSFCAVTAQMDDFLRRKEQSNRDLITALARAGFPLDYDAIASSAAGKINRAHIAAALLEHGWVPSRQAAFDTLLSEEQGYYTPPRRMGSLEAIRFIRSLGAVPVLAHPLLNLTAAELRGFLSPAKEAGLRGMEVRYPHYTAEQIALSAALSREFDLLPSGGSDYHGDNKPDNPMGLPEIPADWLEALRP